MKNKIVKCRSCGADIFFVKHGQKHHPVNPIPKKRFVLIEEYYDLMASYSWQLSDCYESHFNTCPDSVAWREKKTKQFYSKGEN